jgi:hypothetical protein
MSSVEAVNLALMCSYAAAATIDDDDALAISR